MVINILIVLLFLLILSTIYHHFCRKKDFSKFPPPGEMIDVDNNKMHIYGQGEGPPTLLFTCGGGFGFTLGNYYNAFTKLSKKARVVVYDRFGFGWSDSTGLPIQKNLLSLSTNSRLKIIKGADHMFPIKKPDIVTEEIEWFIARFKV